MFENIKRSVLTINQIIQSRRIHEAKMQMIKKNEDWMLDFIDNNFTSPSA